MYHHHTKWLRITKRQLSRFFSLRKSYSLRDCNSIAHISPASLGSVLEVFFTKFPWSTVDDKMVLIFLFNRSLSEIDRRQNISCWALKSWFMSKSIKTFSCVSSVSCPSYLAVSQTVKGENQEILQQKIISRSTLIFGAWWAVIEGRMRYLMQWIYHHI